MFIIYSDYLIIMDTLCVYTNRVECQDAIKLDDIKKFAILKNGIGIEDQKSIQTS